LTNILNQLVANGVLTTTASNTIVDKLNKLDNGVLTKILNAVEYKPEAIALIQTLSKYPNVVEAIKSGDISGLNTSELKIFDSLNVLDNNTLKVLVDYYSNINVKSDDVFDTSSRAESQLIDEDETKLDDTAVSDSGINPPSDISKPERANIDANKTAAINIEAARIYDRIKDPNNKDKVIEILNGYYNVVYKDRHDETKVINMQGNKLLINYMVKNNPKFNKAANPWKIIKEIMPEFFDELAIAKQNAEQSHLGSGIKSVKFLPSNLKVLINKLKILLAERDAGNNNVFDEISAIADELRRTGVLSLKQFKNLYKNLH